MRGIRGFTLIESAVVVFIAGILAVAAVPGLKRKAMGARTSALTTDLRAFAGAFASYQRAHGDWPSGGYGPGVVPPGMEAYLDKAAWSRPTPVGGNYEWDTGSQQLGSSFRAVIVIAGVPGSPVTSDSAQLTDIDRKIDDGDLSGGDFFLGFDNNPVFVLEH